MEVQMSDAIVVLVTAANRGEADTIAEALVAEGLAACVNMAGAIRSIYRWQGEICRDEEQLLIIKSRRALFADLEKRVCDMHSYDVPEVIALPVELGSAAYLQWVADQTADGDG